MSAPIEGHAGISGHKDISPQPGLNSAPAAILHFEGKTPAASAADMRDGCMSNSAEEVQSLGSGSLPEESTNVVAVPQTHVSDISHQTTCMMSREAAHSLVVPQSFRSTSQSKHNSTKPHAAGDFLLEQEAMNSKRHHSLGAHGHKAALQAQGNKRARHSAPANLSPSARRKYPDENRPRTASKDVLVGKSGASQPFREADVFSDITNINQGSQHALRRSPRLARHPSSAAAKPDSPLAGRHCHVTPARLMRLI